MERSPAGAVADLVLLISGPRVNHFITLYARADAVVCPLLRGQPRPDPIAPAGCGGAPGVLSLRHFGLVLLYPLGRVVPNNLARRKNKAIADQSPLLKLSLPRVRFKETSTRSNWIVQKTL